MNSRNFLFASFIIAALLAAQAAPAAERFPPPDFESGYSLPQTQYQSARSGWMDVADGAILVAALSAATWLALKKRSRKGIVALSLFSLAYFGFYRGGCICPIGAIQNVTLGIFDSHYAVPLTALFFFVLPLLFALLFGRVFCGGVCPLGAIQDIFLLRPVTIPAPVQAGLSILPAVYLGLAVLFSALGTMFVICRYDPFVSFFRRSGELQMFIVGGVFLLAAVFIGRPYCRFVCPYRVLLGLFSRFSWRHATITPDNCISCRLCEGVCPFGAIRAPKN